MLSEGFNDLAVAMQNSLHEAMRGRPRGVRGRSSAKDLRQPFIGLNMSWTSHDCGDQAVNGVDSNMIPSAQAAQDCVGLVIGEARLGQAAAAFMSSASRSAFQFQTSNSSSWLFFVRPETMRSRTSVK